MSNTHRYREHAFATSQMLSILLTRRAMSNIHRYRGQVFATGQMSTVDRLRLMAERENKGDRNRTDAAFLESMPHRALTAADVADLYVFL